MVSADHSHATIARVAGVPKSTAQGWRAGAIPSPEKRALLYAFDQFLAPWAWDVAPYAPDPNGAPRPTAAPLVATIEQPAAPPAAQPPAIPDWTPGAADAAPIAPPPLPPREPDPPPPAAYGPRVEALDAPGAARALVMAQLKRLQADTARLRTTRASDAEIRKAEAAETALAMQLAKLAGELNPTEEQRLVKSVKWHAIKAALFKALTPWPDALKAALDAVEAAEVT